MAHIIWVIKRSCDMDHMVCVLLIRSIIDGSKGENWTVICIKFIGSLVKVGGHFRVLD